MKQYELYRGEQGIASRAVQLANGQRRSVRRHVENRKYSSNDQRPTIQEHHPDDDDDAQDDEDEVGDISLQVRWESKGTRMVVMLTAQVRMMMMTTRTSANTGDKPLHVATQVSYTSSHTDNANPQQMLSC
eukprot:jgi/Chrzof1/7763/Cz02g35250.t1